MKNKNHVEIKITVRKVTYSPPFFKQPLSHQPLSTFSLRLVRCPYILKNESRAASGNKMNALLVLACTCECATARPNISSLKSRTMQRFRVTSAAQLSREKVAINGNAPNSSRRHTFFNVYDART